MLNPFLITQYRGADYFCNREKETSLILSAIKNQRHLTLFSIRRLGKTVLIRHVFNKLEKNRKYLTIYIDLLNTQNERDFTNILAISALRGLEKEETRLIKKVSNFFGKFRPKISFDPLTGNPSIELDIKTEEELRWSIETIFSILNKEKKTIIIAIDEFQQINQYSSTSILANLRSCLQKSPNINIIFSGSQMNLLTGMFNHPKQPLYKISQMMPLGKIDAEDYLNFAMVKFGEAKKKVSPIVVRKVLTWTFRHTFYTQFVLNRLFESKEKPISINSFYQIKKDIFAEYEVIFYNYKNLLSKQQWKLLRAIGKSTFVSNPSSKKFITDHNLGAHSTVLQSIQKLLDTEMIYYEMDSETGIKKYYVYDVFLSRWLEEKF